MDMGVKSITKEPAKLAALGVLSVVLLLAIGRTVTSVSGSSAPASPAPASPAPAPTAPGTSPSAGSATAGSAAGSTPGSTAGSTPAAGSASASAGGANPVGIAGAAVAAAHGAAADVAAARAPENVLMPPGATPGIASITTPGQTAADTLTPDAASVAADLAAAAGSTKVAVYFPLAPNQLRNPFMPTPEIEALVHPPVPATALAPAPAPAAPVPARPAPAAPAPGMQMAARPPAGFLPPVLGMAGDAQSRAYQGAPAPNMSAPVAAAPARPPAPRPTPFHVAMDTVDAAAASIKQQVTLKGVLVGNPSTAFATVGKSEQLLHPGDEMPGQQPGLVRFKVARINSDTLSLEVDDRSISVLSGNNIKIADAVAAIRVEIRQ